MSDNPPRPRQFRFGVFQLDTGSGELYKHGLRIKLQDQPFQVLSVLLERPGVVVTREDLQKRLWGENTYVDFDHSLNISINKLRDTLGDSASNPRFIETLPRRGYRFVAPVTVLETSVGKASSPGVSVESQNPSLETPPDGTAVGVKSGYSHLVAWATLALAISLAGGLAGWFWFHHQASVAASRRIMLAVLPFEDLTGDQEPKEAYFAAGLHDELIAQLGRLHPTRLGVIARTSVLPYANARRPIDQIGHDLHVDYVLDGTIRRLGSNFRITAELIQVSDQTHLWTETYQPSLSDMLALQEDVARKVSDALAVTFLPDAQQQMHQNSTSNVAAYEAYLEGRYFWYEETRQSLTESIARFQRAIELDPNYAPAYVGLADSYNVLGGYGFVPADDAFPKGKEAAAKALELAPNLSDAYCSMAFAGMYYDWDFAHSEELFRKAIALNPNNQLAHAFYSSLLHVLGRLDESEAENRIAKELDPLSAWMYDDKGWMLLSRRRPQAAIPEFKRAIELNPRFPAAHLSLAVAYSRVGQFQQALAEVHKAEEAGADPTRALEILGSVQALAGDLPAAHATLDRLLAGAINGRVSPYSIALIYAVLGQKKDAEDWLEKAYREKDTWVVWIGVLVEWDSLRTEPRFISLLHQLRLS